MNASVLTAEGVLETQLRVCTLLTSLATGKGWLLDPQVVWNNGTMALPKPGASWSLRFSHRGRAQTVVLTEQELDGFSAGRADMIRRKLVEGLKSWVRLSDG